MSVIESGEYASGTIKADGAAQPKGCSVCFVPVMMKMQINQIFTLRPVSDGAQIVANGHKKATPKSGISSNA